MKYRHSVIRFHHLITWYKLFDFKLALRFNDKSKNNNNKLEVS